MTVMTVMTVMIETRALRKSFGDHVMLDSIDLRDARQHRPGCGRAPVSLCHHVSVHADDFPSLADQCSERDGIKAGPAANIQDALAGGDAQGVVAARLILLVGLHGQLEVVGIYMA